MRAQSKDGQGFIDSLDGFPEYRRYSRSGFSFESDHYRYSILKKAPDAAIQLATPKTENLRAVIRGVFIVKGEDDTPTSIAILCWSIKPSTLPKPPYLKGEEPSCADRTAENCTTQKAIQ